MSYWKKNRKIIIEGAFFIMLVAMTFYLVFKDNELSDILKSLRLADARYILLSVVLVIIFVCSESVIICYMMRSLKRQVPLSNCIKYSFIGFFYSCITPSATGGQPAQIYYMNKDEIPVPVSTLVLMIVTITYKFVLVIVGVLLCLFFRPLVLNFWDGAQFFLYLGLLLNVGCVTLMYILIFRPALTKKLMHIGLVLIERIRLVRHKAERTAKLSHAMDQYSEAAYFFRDNKMVVFNVLLISVIQRFVLFFVTYFVYLSFGLRGFSAFEIVTMQASISVAVDMLPLPGGVGISEGLFMKVFKPIFGEVLLLSGMLLSRGISYYTLLLISAVVTIYAHYAILRAAHRRQERKTVIEE